MDFHVDNRAWEAMSYVERNHQLYLSQRQMLDLFLERGAISRAQHERGLAMLQRKGGGRT